jgi:hypothetical protein
VAFTARFLGRQLAYTYGHRHESANGKDLRNLKAILETPDQTPAVDEASL